MKPKWYYIVHEAPATYYACVCCKDTLYEVRNLLAAWLGHETRHDIESYPISPDTPGLKCELRYEGICLDTDDPEEACEAIGVLYEAGSAILAPLRVREAAMAREWRAKNASS